MSASKIKRSHPTAAICNANAAICCSYWQTPVNRPRQSQMLLVSLLIWILCAGSINLQSMWLIIDLLSANPHTPLTPTSHSLMCMYRIKMSVSGFPAFRNLQSNLQMLHKIMKRALNHSACEQYSEQQGRPRLTRRAPLLIALGLPERAVLIMHTRSCIFSALCQVQWN